MDSLKKGLKMDDVDIKIIKKLALTGREGIRELARMLGKSPSTIVFRIRRLEKAGVIKGFTALVDYRKLGYQINALTLIQVDGAY
ncbi:MAG TPA: Lrp/AsnC family transcriptional regulator, partial [Acidilobales archaeon]|nr:Lrp/AsnC family transcriptional regulator [Acidilobales archaeon]